MMRCKGGFNMKRWLVSISLIIVLLGFNSLAFGAKGIINVSMNGSNIKVKEVPILMDGQAFVSDVPSFVLGDRTLVPIRFVAESFGAEVQWDQKTKTATVLHDKKVVKLTIDSDKVAINNETNILDKNSIPKLVTFANQDSRTMVPVRFISEVLGYEVGWDENSQTPYINSKEGIEVIDLNPSVTPKPTEPTSPSIPSNTATISSIDVAKGSTSKNRLVIKSNKAIKYSTLFLPDSNKLVIDIENSRLNITGTMDQPGNIKVNDNQLMGITYSQYDTSPFVTRIVVELKYKIEYEFHTSEDGKTTVLTFEDHNFSGVTTDYINGREALVINDISGVKYNVLKLKSPERVVIDLLDTNLADKIYGYDIKVGFIKGVRVSQFAGDNNYSNNDRIVRIVLDIVNGVTDPNIKIDAEKDRLIIYPEKSIWEYISYDNSTLNKLVTIKNFGKANYDVEYNQETKQMNITIPSEDSDLIEGVELVKDSFIEGIKITKDSRNTVVSITFKRGIVFDILSEKRAEQIQLSIKRDPSIPFTDKTIVVDVGHGGKDPGASSPNGTKEKDVNLQIGLKTQRLLESLGYNVIMTRTEDIFVDLNERANIANRNNADIFVSIHHNSTINNTINGLEILYCPMGKGVGKTQDQYPFAQAISKGILSNTGGADRGIIQRPELAVVRQTKMPAVLVEVGYLSNAAEEANIINDSYQNKVVQGIVNGIQNYFEMY